MSPVLNSVSYLLLSAGLAVAAASLMEIGPARKRRLQGVAADAVSEQEESDLERFVLWLALFMMIGWGLSRLPLERIGLIAPGWVPYAGAAGIAIGAYRELTRPREGDDFDVAGSLFMATLGCFWAAVHIHDVLKGKLW